MLFPSLEWKAMRLHVSNASWVWFFSKADMGPGDCCWANSHSALVLLDHRVYHVQVWFLEISFLTKSSHESMRELAAHRASPTYQLWNRLDVDQDDILMPTVYIHMWFVEASDIYTNKREWEECITIKRMSNRTRQGIEARWMIYSIHTYMYVCLPWHVQRTVWWGPQPKIE